MDRAKSLEIPLPSKKGLSTQQAAENRKRYGANVLQRKKPKSLILKILSGLNDPIIRILLAALAVNFVFLFKTFDLYETAGILLAILCATVISAVSERGGELAFSEMLREASAAKCTVLRDGTEQQISLQELVVGDAVRIEPGMKIPADGILLEGKLVVDQSALNGESREAEKVPVRMVPQNFSLQDPHALFRGSVVLQGTGLLWVARVGEHSLYGSLGKQLGESREKSPLKQRLEKLAKQMSLIGYVAAILVALSYLINVFCIDHNWSAEQIFPLLRTPSYLFGHLLQALTLATTVIVVAVPEGLPMMISVVLSRNVKRMKRDRVLVRNATGIETAGSLNLLFTDKTGTLTKGRLSVEGVLLPGESAPIHIHALRRCSAIYRHFERAARYNTISRVHHGKAVGGNTTERAILASVLPFSEKKQLNVSARQPFDSSHKYAAAQVENITYYTGAPEVLSSRVNGMIARDGTFLPLTDTLFLWKDGASYAAQGMRVLAICCEKENLCCLLCLVLLRDVLRKDAAEAVHMLQKAGVQVVMITGDHPQTARNIATECGVLRKGGVVLDGEELSNMSDAVLENILPKLCVVARALPGDKSRLVKLSQKAGYVVGMTGDGINDAPALRCADVGFAMGSGTDVAKEAGDIIITDDAVSSIAKAVLYGRTIFKSIRKFILFQMTTNLSAVAITAICPLLGIDTPITVLQMLWINMIMDTFGSLAFATEAPSQMYMKEAPLPRSGGIMNAYMAMRITFVGICMTVLSLLFLRCDAVQALFARGYNTAVMQCAFFVMFICMDLCNFVSARTTGANPLSGIRKNPAFLLILGLISFIQLCMVYFGGKIFRTVPLIPQELGICVAYGAILLLLSLVMKPLLRLVCRGKCI